MTSDTIEVQLVWELAARAAGRCSMVGLKRVGFFGLVIGAIIVLVSVLLGRENRRDRSR